MYAGVSREGEGVFIYEGGCLYEREREGVWRESVPALARVCVCVCVCVCWCVSVCVCVCACVTACKKQVFLPAAVHDEQGGCSLE